MLSIIVFMLTYRQRRVVSTILWIIALFIVCLCGLYILSVAVSLEAQFDPILPFFGLYNISYGTMNVPFCSLCFVFIGTGLFLYRTLFSSCEDRATVETDPSAQVVVGTCTDSAGYCSFVSARFQPSRAGFVPTK